MYGFIQGQGEVPNPILHTTEVGKLFVALLLKMPTMWRNEYPVVPTTPHSVAEGLEIRRALRMIVPCHMVVFPKLILANSRLIILINLIQKQKVLESPVYLTLPISILSNFLETMETNHTCPLGLATTLPIPWHVISGLGVLKRLQRPTVWQGVPSSSSFTCSFKSSYNNSL